jgi:hypothetical protein
MNRVVIQTLLVSNIIGALSMADGSAQSPKRGRPRKHEANLWFGMKVTAEERQKIKTLAMLEGKSATKAILDLIERSINHRTGKLTPMEIMQLPEGDRRRLLEAQAKKAVKLYA